MLPGAADNFCHTHWGFDDCAFGEQIPTDIVRVGSILLDVLDLHLLCFTGLWIAYGCKFGPESSNLYVSTKCTANLTPLISDVCLSRS